MKAKYLLIALQVTLFLCLPSYADTRFTIHDNSILDIKIGDSIQSVYSKFPEAKIRLENLRQYAEGQFCPGLEIDIDEDEKTALEIMLGWNDGWIIDDIYINDTRFKTTKGVGPGATTGVLKTAYEIYDITFYEGRLYISVKEFDGLFVSQFGGFPAALIDNPMDIEQIPPGLKIEQIRLIGNKPHN